MIDASFVILTWNSGRYIRDCLDSLLFICRKESLRLEIIIVDNGSKDNTLDIITEFTNIEPDLVHLISFEENKGTTFPRNVGLKKASGKFICILDSDTKYAEGSIKKILKKLDGDNSVGIIAPRLILADGTVQNSVKKFPKFWHKLLKIPKVLFGIRLADRDFYRDFPFSETTEVNSAISACWFFKREMLDDVGFLDEKIFYSPEDLDFCIRTVRQGKRILYWPDMTFIHYTQQVSHRRPFSRTSFSHFGGLLYYYKKHGGWF